MSEASVPSDTGFVSTVGYVAPERIGFTPVSTSRRALLDATARSALARYARMRGCKFVLHAAHSNVIYRVETTSKELFALRIGAPPGTACVHVQSELRWMSAVADGTSICTPRPIENDSGDLVTTVHNQAADALSECVLLTWLPGVPAAECLTPTTYRVIGEVSARLHDFGGEWVVPSDLKCLTWDQVFYYPAVPIVIFDPSNEKLIGRALRQTILSTVARANEALTLLYASGPAQVIHGNIEMWNALVSGGTCCLIDFEELTFGYPAQDIAVTLHYGKSHPDYEAFKHAFRAGYESIRPWPVAPAALLELFSAARCIMLMNHALNYSPDPAPFIERAAADLLRYVRRT